ncbi:hypothetical protein P8452_13549 [Trifolium repens]|nr:hypothetical protein P8452_13549 [Trifolium repens]
MVLFSSHKSTSFFFVFLCVAALGSVFLVWQRNVINSFFVLGGVEVPVWESPKLRPVVFNLVDFGGVGDGVALNTMAFERAVSVISKFGDKAHDAVILGIQDENYWPLMPALPSYGHGREHPGPRYGSLIHGQNLKDVVITGHNGTINGQGQTWWTKYLHKLLNHTRGPLVQLMYSSDIVISNITLRDSPFWTLHPYDCKNVTIKNVTILAPVYHAPNTDGIDPDSCEDMLIEDCYISVGDDAIAIKSGWDQYGISYGKPSKNILIRNLVVRSNVSAGISIGSEMSGGVSNVTIENILVWESRRAMRIKTAPGRGGYIRQITYRNLTFHNVRVGIVIKTDYNEHPDSGYDPSALPILRDISFTNIRGEGVRVPCAFVEGRVIGTIFPKPCLNFDQYNEQGELVKHAVSQNITNIDYEI